MPQIARSTGHWVVDNRVVKAYYRPMEITSEIAVKIGAHFKCRVCSGLVRVDARDDDNNGSSLGGYAHFACMEDEQRG